MGEKLQNGGDFGMKIYSNKNERTENEEQQLSQSSQLSYVSQEKLPINITGNYTNINSDFFSFNNVVEYIVNKVCELLGAERAGIMLYDMKNRELVLQRPAFGFEHNEDINDYRVPLNGKGNAINVFLTGIPSISNDTVSDPRYLKKFVLKYGARNTVTVPLEVNSRRIGVLHVDNKKNGNFTQKDVELLSLLSSHLALLLENAAYFKKEKEYGWQLKKINIDLSKQQQRLKKLMKIHGRLIKRVLYGEGLQAVTLTLADLLKCKVIVEDYHFNIICAAMPYSNSYDPQPNELLKRINKIYSFKHILSEDVSKQELFFIPAYPEEGIDYERFVVPLIDKSGILGYLSVLLYEQTLNELDMIAIEQAALVVLLELVREKSAYEIELALKGEFLDLLLRGDFQNEEEIIKRAKYFNYYDYSKSQSVIIVRIQTKDQVHSEDLPIKKPFNDLIFLIKQLFPQNILLTRGNEIIILTAEDKQNNFSERLITICSEIEKKYPTVIVIAGIGDVVPKLSWIKDSFRQARRVLEIISKFPTIGRVMRYNQLGIYTILDDVKNINILHKFVEEKIGPLIKYDKKKNNSFLLTLESYIKNNCVKKEVAKQLFIHVKTVEYRVNRIKSILKISNYDIGTCMELDIAIKIYRIYMEKKIRKGEV